MELKIPEAMLKELYYFLRWLTLFPSKGRETEIAKEIFYLLTYSPNGCISRGLAKQKLGIPSRSLLKKDSELEPSAASQEGRMK